MRIAFYAPMKAPTHPVPSGDRRMARAFWDLLTGLGHEVVPAATFRSYDRAGDLARQRRLALIGAGLAERLARKPRPDLWFTYHLYHKAPDHLGPALSRGFGIPYVVAEASLSPRQAAGPWAEGYAHSLAALGQARIVLAMTAKDLAGLGRALPRERLRLFPPFLDERPYVAARLRRRQARAALAAAWDLDSNQPWLLTVAMMRADAKRDSYRVLAEALLRLTDRPWQLVVVGDGEAADEIRGWFAPLAPRVRFPGALAAEALPDIYAAADLYLWPACNEAYGMALLEAQAAGLPVVAGDEGGVRDVVADGRSGRVTRRRDAAAFAAATAGLLAQPALRAAMGDGALAKIKAEHALGPARERMIEVLRCAFA